MYNDPQTVTINGAASTLPRVPSASPTRIGSFLSNDGNLNLTVHQNQSANRFRRELRLTQRKVAADPISATNKEVTASVVIVVDEPKVGFSDAELTALFTALMSLATAGTNAKFAQLLGGEN